MINLDMTAFLPPNLIALFAPRDRIEFKAPIGELPHEKDRSKNPYSGIASFVQEFDPHSETPAKVSTLGPTKEILTLFSRFE